MTTTDTTTESVESQVAARVASDVKFKVRQDIGGYTGARKLHGVWHEAKVSGRVYLAADGSVYANLGGVRRVLTATPFMSTTKPGKVLFVTYAVA